MSKDVTMCDVARHLVTDLTIKQPQTLPEADNLLRDLLGALRGAINEKMADLKIETADCQAILSEVSIYVEAVEAVVKARANLDKAQVAATAAVEQVFKKLRTPRLDQRVWRKLTPVVA